MSKFMYINFHCKYTHIYISIIIKARDGAHTYIQMTSSVLLHVGALLVVEVLVHGRVGALTVQQQLAVLAQYHRHALAHVVEVEDAQQLVRLLFAELGDSDGRRRARL